MTSFPKKIKNVTNNNDVENDNILLNALTKLSNSSNNNSGNYISSQLRRVLSLYSQPNSANNSFNKTAINTQANSPDMRIINIIRKTILKLN